jgi:hypothetical protein
MTGSLLTVKDAIHLTLIPPLTVRLLGDKDTDSLLKKVRFLNLLLKLKWHLRER